MSEWVRVLELSTTRVFHFQLKITFAKFLSQLQHKQKNKQHTYKMTTIEVHRNLHDKKIQEKKKRRWEVEEDRDLCRSVHFDFGGGDGEYETCIDIQIRIDLTQHNKLTNQQINKSINHSIKFYFRIVSCLKTHTLSIFERERESNWLKFDKVKENYILTLEEKEKNKRKKR